ncbi:Cupin domain protein [Lacunisphaera limnophila]|uniref:Cupin domain protein n=1 Tax=Lacunisphaera limnophila TaxID=1838286 RepID=A0A1D8ATS7_9BACT|nr:cupin domain-containing protein [Lacunisphaera limnophila]AOS44270.1 Cupin domain protein [Lacunisphaera limnophila]
MRPSLLATLLAAASILPALAEPVGPAAGLISHYGMEKIPGEGAWFKVTYNSTERIPAAALPPRYGAPRLVGTSIYALVTREDFSAMHRLLTDEIWHFYQGDPIELLLLHPDGRSEVVTLGSDPLAGQQPQYTVLAGTWMGARPVKATPAGYAFFGCTMAPGFDYADYEPGYRDDLQKQYPAAATLIDELTRAEFVTKPAAPAPAATMTANPTVFLPTAVAPISVSPGVELRELVGLVGHAKTGRTSVAHFALAPGKTTGMSYMKTGEEYFLVIKGRGTVVVGDVTSPVEPGSIVFLAPAVRHAITAAPDTALEFYAVSTLAFSPDDYVPVP